MVFTTNKEKGNSGLVAAIAYYGFRGYTISLPLNIAYSISNYTGFFTFLIGNDLILALIGTITFWFVVSSISYSG